MGCDIHLHIEIRKNGVWEHHNWESELVTGHYEDGSKMLDYDKLFEHPLYIGRNYDLFAILANVRNGYGFAGCDTGNGFVPIAQPRGLPSDVTASVKKESDNWGCDGHSHSHFTLSELLAYDWKQSTVHRGYVGESEFKEWREKGKSESWCGDVSGSRIAKVTNKEMARIVDGKQKRLPDKEYFTQVSWKEPYSESASHFVDKFIPEIQKLGNPDDVRIVFWFDN